MGCTKVSPGCAACYAEREHIRFGRDFNVVKRSKTKFAEPMKWQEGRLIFTCSWSDWFHEAADQWRPEAWEVIRACPQHTFQILTKRPELIPDRLPDDWGSGYPNVWLGVSIENARHTFRADLLRQVPAALRFISAEPLLGTLFPAARGHGDRGDPGTALSMAHETPARHGGMAAGGGRAPLNLAGIDWVIVGGESGPRDKARPMHPDWAREIRDAALAVSIEDEPFDLGRLRPALHMKQFGSWAPVRRAEPHGNDVWLYPDARTETLESAEGHYYERGVDGEYLHPDGSGAVLVRYAGPAPTAGGKTLDQVDWCEIPERLAPLTLI